MYTDLHSWDNREDTAKDGKEEEMLKLFSECHHRVIEICITFFITVVMPVCRLPVFYLLPTAQDLSVNLLVSDTLDIIE